MEHDGVHELNKLPRSGKSRNERLLEHLAHFACFRGVFRRRYPTNMYFSKINLKREKPHVGGPVLLLKVLFTSGSLLGAVGAVGAVGATCRRVHLAPLQGHASALFALHHLIIIRHPSLSSISDASACRQPDLYLHD